MAARSVAAIRAETDLIVRESEAIERGLAFDARREAIRQSVREAKEAGTNVFRFPEHRKARPPRKMQRRVIPAPLYY